MNKILVVGSSGLVGSKFLKECSKLKNICVLGVDERIVDITNIDSIDKYFVENSHHFGTVVNFAAVADVDGAEKERDDRNGFVWKLNVQGVENLVKICSKYEKHLVQISTDFVFEGTEKSPGPYKEDTQVPMQLLPTVGWYGYTKAVAEKIVIDSQHGAVVRISYPFYAEKFENKLDFAKNYLKLYDKGNLYPIFEDQTFTPLLVDELTEPILKIAKEKTSGIFHMASSDSASMSGFVEYLLEKARGVKGVIKKTSMKEFLKVEGRTPRPRLGGLKTDTTQVKLGLKFKTWKEMIDCLVSNL